MGVTCRIGGDSWRCRCSRVVCNAWSWRQQLRPRRQHCTTACWLQPQTRLLTQASISKIMLMLLFMTLD